MFNELRPTRKAVAARYEELRVGQGAVGHTLVRLLDPVPLSFDSLCIPADLSTSFGPERPPLEAGQRPRPARGPIADCTRLARPTCLLEVFCELLVLLEVGTRWKRKCVRHTNLLSLPGVRTNQAERRFVTFGVFGWVGTALSADWMRP